MSTSCLGRSTGAGPPDRAALEALHEPVWNTEELGRVFVLIGLQGAELTVVRKADGAAGVLTAQTGPPQFFYHFRPAWYQPGEAGEA